MQALGLLRRGHLLRLSFPVDEFPPRDYVFVIACPELSLPPQKQHRASPITLVRDMLAQLPLVRELEKANGGQRVGLVLHSERATELWLDEAVPLYAFDLGERLETLELRTRPRNPPPMPLRLLAETSDRDVLLVPVAPWVCVDGSSSVASLLSLLIQKLRLAANGAYRLVRHTDEGWEWLSNDAALRSVLVPGDVLSARAPPLMELSPQLEPPPAPLLLPLDTSVADACRRLSGFVPGAAAEHPLWRPWSGSGEEASAFQLYALVNGKESLRLQSSRPLAHYHAALVSASPTSLILRPSASSPPVTTLASSDSTPFEALTIRITFVVAPASYAPPPPAPSTSSSSSSSSSSAPSLSSGAASFPTNMPPPSAASRTSNALSTPPSPPTPSPLTTTTAPPLSTVISTRPKAISTPPAVAVTGPAVGLPRAVSPPPFVQPPATAAPPPVPPSLSSTQSTSSSSITAVPTSVQTPEGTEELDSFICIPGEIVLQRGVHCAVQEGWAAGVEMEEDAQFTVTSYRVIFMFAASSARPELQLPHHSVARIEKVGAHAAEVESKHCFVFRVRFKGAQGPEYRRLWLSSWEDAVQGVPFALRSLGDAAVKKAQEEESAQQLEEHYTRLFTRAPGKWRLSDVNRDFSLCASYGKLLVVPAPLTDDALKAVASFRSKGRIPFLSYIHTNGAPLLRSSQPKPGISRWRCAEDERLLELAMSSGGKGQQMALYDARPRMHAMANQALGAGVEATANYPFLNVAFLSVPNIHVMRESFVRLQAALGVQAYDWTADADAWLPALERSEWLAHIKLLLHGAQRLALSLHRDANAVLVHCSDGWDRTSQLVALALLMLEPEYRTMQGFALLVHKEWLAPGHKFHVRCGHPTIGSTAPAAKSVEEGRAPIFLQFLDATSQLMAQFPCAFEFSDAFLLAIADALFSCRFGTFLFNTEKERYERGAKRVPSLWNHLSAHAATYASPYYVATEVILPDVRSVSLRFWTEYFLRERRTQREGDDTRPEERGRALKSTCEALYRQIQDAEKELRRLRTATSTKAPTPTAASTSTPAATAGSNPSGSLMGKKPS